MRAARRAAAALIGLTAALTAGTTAGPPSATALRFEDGTGASGIRFQHVPTRTPRRFLPEVMGSGLAVADFDRNGAPDLVVVNSGALGAARRPDDARTRLFLNDGRGGFSDASDAWGLPSSGYGMGAAAGDYDGDGWTDLFLTTYEGVDVLLRNEGGRFTDVTARAGIRPDGRWSTSAGFFDLERDGDLDLWVVRYVAYDPRTATDCFVAKVHVYCTPLYLGLGPANRIDELTIYWPGSRPQVLTAVAAGAHYRIVEGQTPERYVPGQAGLRP